MIGLSQGDFHSPMGRISSLAWLLLTYGHEGNSAVIGSRD
jgi:hypothetical protein